MRRFVQGFGFLASVFAVVLGVACLEPMPATATATDACSDATDYYNGRVDARDGVLSSISDWGVWLDGFYSVCYELEDECNVAADDLETLGNDIDGINTDISFLDPNDPNYAANLSTLQSELDTYEEALGIAHELWIAACNAVCYADVALGNAIATFNTAMGNSSGPGLIYDYGKAQDDVNSAENSVTVNCR